MEINRDNIFEIVKGLNITAIKQLGQNFLVNPKYSSLIVENSQIKQEDKVLEIGPGLGSLTHFLVNTSNDVTTVDIDERMVKFLNVQYENNPNLHIISGDALKIDLSSYDVIIGNLPYYITTDIITNTLLKANNAHRLVFMVQKEAYQRFSAKTNEEDYGAISILIQLLGSIKKITNVGQGAFYPNPHVDSLVFVIDIDLKNRNERNFNIYKLAKSLFLNRRKTILNNLGNFLKNRDFAQKTLEKCNILPSKRPEELSLEDFKNIYDNIQLEK